MTLAIRTVYEPIGYGFSETSETFADFFTGLFQANRLVEENARLKSLAESAALYEENIKRLEDENKRLRALSTLPDVPGKTKIPAAVWAYWPNESRATLSIGADDGIKKGMPVVAAAGLYGQVQTLDKHSCQVLLISSPQFRITGKVSRDPPPIGFIQGQSTGAMVFDVVDAKVLPQNGDKVFTSGLSERIPEGILIGTIVQKEEDIAYGSERCQVYPAVTIGAVREVFVLK